MTGPLSILGAGLYLPPARSTREVAAELGADTTRFKGWDHIRVALDDDHPSTMAAAALHDAMAEAACDPSELALVVSVGHSRDYLPSWSVATEVMRLCDASGACVGLDLSIGCLGTLAALNVVQGWLSVAGGGYAAIVAAERWSDTVDRSRNDLKGLWGHSDGAGALVVGLDTPGQPLAEFLGAEFTTISALNGAVLVKYGGTRFPVAPPDENPHLRRFGDWSPADLWERYVEGYSTAFRAAQERFGLQPSRMICNQIGAAIVDRLPELAGLPADRAVITGHDSGHVGPADIMLGLRHLLDAKELDGPVLIASSTPYAFGAGWLVPPPRTP
jgi:3-oxoacyl-[acyl-carrier-protein] synthase III